MAFKIGLFVLRPALGHICYLQLDSERNFHIIAYLNLDFVHVLAYPSPVYGSPGLPLIVHFFLSTLLFVEMTILDNTCQYSVFPPTPSW